MFARHGEKVDKMGQGGVGWSKIQTSEKEIVHGDVMYIMGFPGGTSGKELPAKTEDIKRHGFNPWVRKIPWRRAWEHSSILAHSCPESQS